MKGGNEREIRKGLKRGKAVSREMGKQGRKGKSARGDGERGE